MKKLAMMTVTVLFSVSALTACGSSTALDPAALQQTQIVEEQAFGSTTLSMKKQNTNEPKISGLKIKDKMSKGAPKDIAKLVVKFKNPSAKNNLDERDIANIARYTLSSMNSSQTYTEGYKIGVMALDNMARQGVYVARVSWASANSTKDWENGYKVVAAALNHIAAENPNTPAEACNLVMNMMNACKDYADAYRVGFAAMQVVGNTDNPMIRNITDLALRQAGGTTDWEDGFNVLRNAFLALRNSF
jgi:hypothetical protein